MIGAAELWLLLAWGTIVAVDLVSMPQALLARPLVAATVAGAIAGDAGAGLAVGLLVELFALDVLPVGAARYPDYGPGTVGAVLVVAHHPAPVLWMGVAVGLALVVALSGAASMQWLRHRIARDVQAHAGQLAAGDGAAIRMLHLTSIGRDAVRGLALTVVALLLALLLRGMGPLDELTGTLLTVVAAGAGLAAVIRGAARSAGRGARFRWLAAGASAGVLLSVLL
ncbi:MAG TPA: PTS sugar transporter subunit IIC [Gemmatimonadales bacterium]|nr:PTS sugar transporter subunit IIC [Gemmatimonadales bacterium]